MYVVDIPMLLAIVHKLYKNSTTVQKLNYSLCAQGEQGPPGHNGTDGDPGEKGHRGDTVS